MRGDGEQVALVVVCPRDHQSRRQKAPSALQASHSYVRTATAAVVWSGDLPRPLQQILFDAADGITPRAPARIGEHAPAVIAYRPRLLAAGCTPASGAGPGRLGPVVELA